MSSSTTFSSKLFPVIAVVTLVATAFALVAIHLEVEVSGGWGIVGNRAVTVIDPHNHAAYRRLGRDELEAAQYVQAQSDLVKACGLEPTQTQCAELLGAYYAITDNRPGAIAALLGPQTNVEARSALLKLNGSQTTKAQQLYDLGLVRSSQRLVSKIHQDSVPLELLKAQIALATLGNRGGDAAMRDINKALHLNPTSKQALKQALVVSQQTSNASDVAVFKARLAALK